MTYYKFLHVDGTPCHGGSGRWHLPKDGQPAKWMRLIRNIELCVRGYHVCDVDHLIAWLGPALYTVEGDGVPLRHLDSLGKAVFQRARLLEKVGTYTPQLIATFALDCIEHVLTLWDATDAPLAHEKIATARQALPAGTLPLLTFTELWGTFAWKTRSNSYINIGANAAYRCVTAVGLEHFNTGAWAAFATDAAYAARYAAGSFGFKISDNTLNDAALTAEHAWQSNHLRTLLGLPR